MGQAFITRRGAGAGNGLPQFTYTGTYSLLDDGDGNWRLKLLTSGTLTFTKATGLIDVFMVGGGAGGVLKPGYMCGSGAGGRTKTISYVPVKNTQYAAVIGAGGAGLVSTAVPNTGNAGGDTSLFGETAAGGSANYINSSIIMQGGAGGSGASVFNSTTGYVAGDLDGASDGANGNKTSGTTHIVGAGQGTTTREFGEATGDLYGGSGAVAYNDLTGAGGAGGGGTLSDGVVNSGGGGAAKRHTPELAWAGGSGIICFATTGRRKEGRRCIMP